MNKKLLPQEQLKRENERGRSVAAILCPLTDYYAMPCQGPHWRGKGFLDRWGWAPYRAIQGAFRTAHWPFMRPSLHSSWGGDICMHDRMPGYKGKCPHSCRWQRGRLDDLVRKTPCVGESDNMCFTNMRSPL